MTSLDFVLTGSKDSESTYSLMSSLDMYINSKEKGFFYADAYSLQLSNFNLAADGTSLNGGFLKTGPDSEIDFYTGRNSNSSGMTVYTITSSGNETDGLVITSSAGSYPNGSNYYNMEYLFNGVETGGPDTYWLTSSSGNQTLTFDFSSTSISAVKKIRVVPWTRGDARSNYWLEKSADNTTWVSLNDSDGTAIGTSGSPIDTSSYVAGDKVIHFVEDTGGVLLSNYPYIRFNLTQEGSYGVTLHQIEMLSAEGSVLGVTNTEIVTYKNVYDSDYAKGINVEENVFITASDESIRYEENLITPPGSGGAANPESWS